MCYQKLIVYWRRLITPLLLYSRLVKQTILCSILSGSTFDIGGQAKVPHSRIFGFLLVTSGCCLLRQVFLAEPNLSLRAIPLICRTCPIEKRYVVIGQACALLHGFKKLFFFLFFLLFFQTQRTGHLLVLPIELVCVYRRGTT